MKKYCLFIVFVGLLLSCSTDEGQHANEISQGRKEYARDLLKKMNDENPYSAFGISHNQMVGDLMSGFSQMTRSEGDTIALHTFIKQKVMCKADSSITVNCITDYSLRDFEEDYDSVMNSVFVSHTSLSEMATEYGLGAKACSYISDVEEIISRNDDYVHKLSLIAQIQNDILHDSSCMQKEEVLAVISITANSCELWGEILEDLPTTCGSISVGAAIEADAMGAGNGVLTSIFNRILNNPFRWKAVIASSAAASALNVLSQINWKKAWYYIEQSLKDRVTWLF